MYRLSTWLLIAVLTPALFGCGDDDDVPADGGTAGGKDGGAARDSGRPPLGGRDAGGDAGPEALPMCPKGECDLLDPMSCGAAESCVFARADGEEYWIPQCAPAGTSDSGDPCTSTSDCAAGLACTAFDGTGICRSYCCALSHTQECPSGQFCRLGIEAEQRESGVGLCDRCDGCDPLDPDACGSGRSCYPLPGSLECTACLPPGKRVAGARCTLSTDCVKGSACFRLEDDSSQCIEFCELDSDGPCSDSARKCKEVPGAKLPPGVALCL